MTDQTFSDRWIRGRLALPLMFLCVLSGCGPARPVQLAVFPVHGHVLYNSQPVSGATVAFYQDGAAVPASGLTDAKGEYQLSTYAENDGAVVGKHRVTVTLPTVPLTDTAAASPAKPPKAIADLESPEYQAAMQKLQSAATEGSSTSSAAGIPAKYASIQTTDLVVEVRNVSENTIDLPLRD